MELLRVQAVSVIHFKEKTVCCAYRFVVSCLIFDNPYWKKNNIHNLNLRFHEFNFMILRFYAVYRKNNIP